jgi:hypothetical protein
LTAPCTPTRKEQQQVPAYIQYVCISVASDYYRKRPNRNSEQAYVLHNYCPYVTSVARPDSNPIFDCISQVDLGRLSCIHSTHCISMAYTTSITTIPSSSTRCMHMEPGPLAPLFFSFHMLTKNSLEMVRGDKNMPNAAAPPRSGARGNFPFPHLSPYFHILITNSEATIKLSKCNISSFVHQRYNYKTHSAPASVSACIFCNTYISHAVAIFPGTTAN